MPNFCESESIVEPLSVGAGLINSIIGDYVMNRFLDDIANNTPNSSMFDQVKQKSKKLRHQVINLNNYERYWDNSTPTGHQIRIVNKDDSTLTLNLNWPKDYNPRLHDIDERTLYGGIKSKSQRLKKKNKTTRRGTQ